MTKTSKTSIENSLENFATPFEIVASPAFSKQEKVAALQKLEQDARLLSIASDEGMAGGEPTNLQEVLDAREALELPPTEYAYEVVRRDLKTRQAAAPRDGTQVPIDHAIAALDALQHAPAASAWMGAENSALGSAAEIAAETELEKLDP